jgi:hypothetical protein
MQVSILIYEFEDFPFCREKNWMAFLKGHVPPSGGYGLAQAF